MNRPARAPQSDPTTKWSEPVATAYNTTEGVNTQDCTIRK
jgi:hypothetical protein